MNSTKIDALLALTHDSNPNVRRTAVRELCPCEVRADNSDVWERIFELATDSDVGVRRLVFHSMIDGSPRDREREVVETIEMLRDDPSPKLQRLARKQLATYRRTGQINLVVG